MPARLVLLLVAYCHWPPSITTSLADAYLCRLFVCMGLWSRLRSLQSSQSELVSADARVSAAPMVLKRGMAVNTEQPMTADITKVFLDLGLRGQVGSIKQQKGCYCPPCHCATAHPGPISSYSMLTTVATTPTNLMIAQH